MPASMCQNEGSMVQVHTILATIEPFASLPESERHALANTMVVRRYENGAHLFFEGEECKGIWIVAEGAVKIVKATPSGRQVMLALQTAPATVAEVPVFDGGPYPASASAVDDTVALLILKDDFLAACRRNPVLSMSFLAVFGARLRHLVNLVERITFGSIRQRLAKELLAFADAAGSNRYSLPETHEELASRLGTVREVVSRNLGRFQGEGMLRILRREVEILDRKALQSEADTEL
ncbi:MAG: Crp/Fnr family transcriptional regulator [Candidatus Solibacter usitatus]|nr:Crp/Fnr family transcriptional regulator [Candidatus Solibacter usitatus]